MHDNLQPETLHLQVESNSTLALRSKKYIVVAQHMRVIQLWQALMCAAILDRLPV